MNEIVTPRRAASLLMLRETPLEVLMVRRSSKGSFGSALVFPGGVLATEDEDRAWEDLIEDGDDPQNDRGLRIAALRETFEETGILPIVDRDGILTTFQPEAADRPFMDIVRSSGGRLPLDQLVHFGHWITPEAAPKRFDTHFFLLSAPNCDHARCDGHETVAVEWRTAANVIATETCLPFPTRLNLSRLGESPDIDHALAAAGARERFTVLPKVVKREGGTFVVIPEAAGYGITEEQRQVTKLV